MLKKQPQAPTSPLSVSHKVKVQRVLAIHCHAEKALEVCERGFSHGRMVRDDRALNLEAMDDVLLATVSCVLEEEGSVSIPLPQLRNLSTLPGHHALEGGQPRVGVLEAVPESTPVKRKLS
jgi:hypothetical protein